MDAFFIVVTSLLVASLLHRWFQRPSVKHVKGPPSPSFWLGKSSPTNVSFAIKIMQVISKRSGAGSMAPFIVLEAVWVDDSQQDVLVVCDPKALGHIFHPSRPYPKSNDFIFMLGLFVGKGVGVVAGEPHKRQRKILNPAFSSVQLRNSQVIFQQCSDKLVNGIKGSLTGLDDTVNVLDWTSKVSLDIIGLASFRYDFSSLDGQETELGQAMKHLFTASQTNISALELIFVALVRMLPDSVLGLLQLISTREIRLIASVGNMAKKTAREVIANHSKMQTLDDNRDVVNLLARARSAGKMQDDEIEAQLMTFVVAGHESSSTSLSWMLYELAMHPEHQSIIRAELEQSNDYDSMPFFNAAIKETLRLYPIGHSLILFRLSGETTRKSGTQLGFLITLCLYIWVLDPVRASGNCLLRMTFPPVADPHPTLVGGDSRMIMEMQTILANLIRHFEFSLPEGGVEIVQFPSSPAVVPVVKDEAHLGSQLPLRIIKLVSLATQSRRVEAQQGG
ncbi:cytochrome P450 [Armillaria nabsnona]|nr:cytochrome P450 [Armillaria nabsnona]